MPYTAFNVMTSIVAGTLCFLVAIVVAIAHAKLAMLIASWITGYSPN